MTDSIIRLVESDIERPNHGPEPAVFAFDGSEEVFVAGDTFFLPKGSSLTWVVYETVRKFYLTAE